MTNLLKSFDLFFPALVALVGSGGKTTLMFALAKAAIEAGSKVITTTTTKIFPPEPAQSPRIILSDDDQSLSTQVAKAFETNPHVTLARGLGKEGKLSGLPPELVDDLSRQGLADLIIVEADGAKMRPLKAPGPFEPVIPSRADLIIPVIGLAGLGRPLDEATVFRPDRFAAVTGLALGAAITVQSLATVIFHPDGLCRMAPARARIVPFLNQADQVALSVVELAWRAVLEAGGSRCSRVVWGSLGKGDVVQLVLSNVGD